MFCLFGKNQFFATCIKILVTQKVEIELFFNFYLIYSMFDFKQDFLPFS